MKQEAVLDAAIRVLLANNGASLNEIAAAAGIGRTTLHRYFTNREELLQALNEMAILDAERAIAESRLEEGPVVEAIERVVQGLLPIGHRFQFLLREGDIQMSKDMEARWTHLEDLFDQLMRRGQQEEVLRRDLPARWLNDSLTALIFVAWEGIHNGHIAPRDAPRLIMTTFLAGTGIGNDGR